MTYGNNSDLLGTTIGSMLGQSKLGPIHGSLPESIVGLLRVLHDEALAKVPEKNGSERARLKITIREIDLVLAEMQEPFWRGRPLWPRAVAIIARMIEDGLLE